MLEGILTTALITVAVGASTALQQRRLAGTRARSLADGRRELRYAWGYRVLFAFWALVLLMAAPALTFALEESEDSLGWLAFVTLLVVGFAWAGLYCLFEGSSRVTFSEAGLVSEIPWRGRRELSWDEVEEVAFSEAFHYWCLTARDGRRFRVSLYLDGFRELFAVLHEQVPEDRWTYRPGESDRHVR
ncbi:MAG: hypothetical protein AAF533_03590 [Acidobacteriota bacterium]